MAHGAGGKATQTLIEGLLAPRVRHPRPLERARRRGRVSVDGLGLALTTDTYVVKPLRFPGGSIGELAVNGTVNDLAAAGARPLAISLALVLEEGLEADVLRAEVEAIAARRRRAAGVEVVTGDTKVVERGHADGMYVTHQRDRRASTRAPPLAPASLQPGDRVLVSRHDRRARDRDHARPRRARARRRGRVRHALAVAGRRRAARAPPGRAADDARRDSRRRRHRAQRARPRLAASAIVVARGRRSRSARRSAGAASCSGSTRCTSPTRA